MRRFELNEKDVEFVSNYLRLNGYSSKICENDIIATDDEDIEIKTILDDNNIKYTESNPHPDEILLDISEQLDALSEAKIPLATFTLISGKYISVSYLYGGTKRFFCVEFHDCTGWVTYLRTTRNCEFDELHLITDYINEILDMENAQ